MAKQWMYEEYVKARPAAAGGGAHQRWRDENETATTSDAARRRERFAARAVPAGLLPAPPAVRDREVRVASIRNLLGGGKAGGAVRKGERRRYLTKARKSSRIFMSQAHSLTGRRTLVAPSAAVEGAFFADHAHTARDATTHPSASHTGDARAEEPHHPTCLTSPSPARRRRQRLAWTAGRIEAPTAPTTPEVAAAGLRLGPRRGYDRGGYDDRRGGGDRYDDRRGGGGDRYDDRRGGGGGGSGIGGGGKYPPAIFADWKPSARVQALSVNQVRHLSLPPSLPREPRRDPRGRGRATSE